MIRSLLVALILVSMPTLAQAQKAKASNPGAEHKFSVGTGIGFASSLGTQNFSTSGFLWQIDGQYRVTDPISIGIFMQVSPFDIPVPGNFFGFGVLDATMFTFAVDSRYHFDFLHSQSNDFVSKLTPYAGLGMGLWHLGADVGPFATSLSDNAFLFSIIFGIEYDLTEHFALTSDMRFNILGGTAPTINDHFNYTWQLAGVRYRF